jgi:hypothetical protein
MLEVVSSWWRHRALPVVQCLVEAVAELLTELVAALVVVLVGVVGVLVGLPIYVFCGTFLMYCETTTALGRWRGHAMWQRYRVHGHPLPGRVVNKSQSKHVYSVVVEYYANHYQKQRQYRYTRTLKGEEKEWQALLPNTYYDDLLTVWPGHPKSAQLSSTVRQVDPDFLPRPDLNPWLGLILHYFIWFCAWLTTTVLVGESKLYYLYIWWLILVGAPLIGLTLYYLLAKNDRDAALHRMLYGAQRVTTATMDTVDAGDSTGDSDPVAEVNHDDYHHHDDDDDDPPTRVVRRFLSRRQAVLCRCFPRHGA